MRLPQLPSLALVLVLLFSCPATAQSIDQHQLTLKLFPNEHRLSGSDTIVLAMDTTAPLVLVLSAKVKLESVTAGDQELSFKRRGEQILVEIPPKAASPFELTLNFSASFDDRPPQQPSHNEDPGYGVVASIQPEGSFISGGIAWYPRRPGTDQQLELQVIAPVGYLAVTAGELLQQTNTAGRSVSRWRPRHPVTGLALAAGPFTLQESRAGEIPIYAYFRQSSASLAPTYLEAARGYMELYQQLLGPYPFAKFAIVENFYPTGYGFPSWTLLGSSVIQLPFIVKTSLGHEIAHSWWGTGIGVDMRGGNWSEGLTTYLADYLYQERESPAAARDYRLKLLRDYATLRDDHDFPLSSFGGRYDKLSQAIGYGKGAMLFHMLRQKIGDQAFWQGLRQIVATRMYGRASWDDLIQAFSAAAGEDLRPFAKPWLERTGAPHLHLEATIKAASQGWETQLRLQQDEPLFPLYLPLVVTTASGSKTEWRSFTTATQETTIRTREQPLRVEVDPDAQVFRLLDLREVPASINHLRASDRLTVVLPPPQQSSKPAVERLLAGLRQTKAEWLETRVAETPLPDGDLLIVGRPRSLPPLLGKLEPLADGDDPAVSQIQLLRRADEPQRVVAIYLPGSGETAIRVAGKIPHYGKYSSLRFVDGQNREKQIFEPEYKPLRIDFDETAEPQR